MVQTLFSILAYSHNDSYNNPCTNGIYYSHFRDEKLRLYKAKQLSLGSQLVSTWDLNSGLSFLRLMVLPQ